MHVSGDCRSDSGSVGSRSGRLPFMACVSTACCGAQVLLLTVEHRAGVLHFHYVPFVGLGILVFLAASASVVLALADLVRGRRAFRSLAWAALAISPALLWCAVAFTGIQNWRARYVPKTFLMNLALRAGASLMEAEADWRYPQRIPSRRVVMYYFDLSRPHRDVVQMERHLQSLEKLMGRRLREPVHWVRGSLLRHARLSTYGLALGSFGDGVSMGNGIHPALDALDRHEAAHAAINQWIPPDADPPTLLMEGWAEAVARGWLSESGKSHEAAHELLALRQSPNYISIKELLSSSWYHRDQGPVYTVGAHAARFLVDRAGAPKFLELYVSIRPHNVEEVLRRVYRLDSASLERELFRESDELTASDDAGHSKTEH